MTDQIADHFAQRKIVATDEFLEGTPQRERLRELGLHLRPGLGAPVLVQHRAQDTVDAKPRVPEALVGVALFVHLVFGPRDEATLIVRRGRWLARERRCWGEILARLAPLIDPLLRHLDGVGVSVPFGGVHHVWRRGYVMLVNITAVADAHERLRMPEGALRLVRLPFDLPAPVLDVFSHI